MWKDLRWGLVFLVFLLLLVPIFSLYSQDVKQMTTEELLSELMMLSVEEKQEQIYLKTLLTETSNDLKMLSMTLPPHLRLLGKVSPELRIVHSELTMLSPLLNELKGEIVDSKKLLKNYEKDLKIAQIKGVVIGVSVGVIVGGVVMYFITNGPK